MLLLSWLLACGGPDAEPSGADAEGPGEPSPYIYEEDAPPVPPASAAELEAVLQDAVDVALTFNARPIFEAYERVMNDRGTYCPAEYATDEGTYWLDECTAESGAWYSGFLFTGDLVDVYDPFTQTFSDARSISGGATVLDAEGHRFTASGTAYWLESESDAFIQYLTVLQGSFGWDGPGSEGTWLEGTLSPDLTSVAYRVPATNGHLVVLDGGVSGLSGAASAVAFEDVVIFDLGLGSTCWKEPSGTISVRSTDGSWTDILFDGPPDIGEPATGACDGCGRAFYRGEVVGEVCADFSPLLGWGTSPW